MKKLTLVLSMMIALIGLNANAAMYIVGTSPMGNGWNPNDGIAMTDNLDGTYTYDVTIDGDVWFCFAEALTPGNSNDDWSVFNGQYRYGPTGGDQTVTATEWTTTQKQGNGNGSYKFHGSGDKYTVTFDKTNLKFKIDGYVEPVVYESFTVAGNNADIFGAEWNVTLTENDMTLDETDGLYKLVKENVEITNAPYTLYYKVAANHAWGESWGNPEGPDGNQDYVFPENGTYDLTFKFNFDTKEVSLDAVQTQVGPEVDDFYTVAGSENLFGSYWNATDSLNRMTEGENGMFTWTKVGFEATAGTEVEFKVVANGNWNTCWPVSDENGDNNWWYQFSENGTYDVVITFNEETKEITFNATKQGGEEPVEDTYTVAGTQNLFGSDWDPADEANNMVKGEDGIYTWTKTGVEFADVDTIEFKVVKNHSWDVASYPENNWWHRIATAGTYDFVITFNPAAEAGQEITFTATKQGGEEPVEMVYTVVGPESVFGSNWDPADEANNMVKGEDGIYTWTKEEVTLYGNFEFKVVGNHDYAIYEWPMGPNNWVANLTEGEGVYTVAITFNPEAADSVRIACRLTKTADITPVEHTYTVAGTENLFGSNWNQTDEANDMVKGEDGIYTWTKTGVEFAAEAVVEFKVVQDHAWDYAWPSSNWWWQCTEDGTYNVVITFDPTAEAGQEITFTATKVEVPTILRGDVNQDNAVNITDVTSLINLLLKGGEKPAEADCNVDDIVNITDVTTLINYLLKGQW